MLHIATFFSMELCHFALKRGDILSGEMCVFMRACVCVHICVFGESGGGRKREFFLMSLQIPLPCPALLCD